MLSLLIFTVANVPFADMEEVEWMTHSSQPPGGRSLTFGITFGSCHVQLFIHSLWLHHCVIARTMCVPMCEFQVQDFRRRWGEGVYCLSVDSDINSLSTELRSPPWSHHPDTPLPIQVENTVWHNKQPAGLGTLDCCTINQPSLNHLAWYCF